MNKERNASFDVGRALCVLMIVGVHHVYDYVPGMGVFIPRAPEMAATAAALSFFFFASGYLLARRTTISGFPDAVRFWKRRLVRIFPLYVLSILLLSSSCARTLRILAFIGINNFLPDINGHNIPTLWFVSQLILYYAALPGILLLRGKAGGMIYATGAMLLVEILFFSGFAIWGWDKRLWWYFPCFASGVLLSCKAETSLFLFSLPLTALFLLLATVRRPMWIIVLYNLCGAATVFALSSIVARIPIVRPFFGTVAYASFSAYLFHRPLYRLASQLVAASGWQRMAGMICLAAPCVFLIAWTVQILYDRIATRPRCSISSQSITPKAPH